MNKFLVSFLAFSLFALPAWAVAPQPTMQQTIQSNGLPAYSAPLHQPNNYATALRKIITWTIGSTASGATYVTQGNSANLTISGGTVVPATDGTWVSLNTGAGLGASATVNGTFCSQIQVGPIYYFQIQPTGTLTGIRYWEGLFSGNPITVNTLASIQGVGFRFSDGAGDTVWQEVTSNGTTQTTTPNSLGIAPVAGTTVYGVVDCSVAGQATFYINGQRLDTIATTLPSATISLDPINAVGNTVAAVRSLKVGTIILSSN